MVGSVLVAMPGSIHIYSTFVELQLLIMPRHDIHIPARPLFKLGYGCRLRLGVRLGVRLECRRIVRFRVCLGLKVSLGSMAGRILRVGTFLLRVRVRVRVRVRT